MYFKCSRTYRIIFWAVILVNSLQHLKMNAKSTKYVLQIHPKTANFKFWIAEELYMIVKFKIHLFQHQNFVSSVDVSHIGYEV